MQETGGRAVDPKAITGPDAPTGKKPHGELVFGIRVDSVPASEADRLAGEGKFYPLTVDADGFLRVVLPENAKVETEELEVQRASHDLLIEIRDLLMKIA